MMLSRPSSLTGVVTALSCKADFKQRLQKEVRAKGEERWLVLEQEVTDKYPGNCPCFDTLL